MNRFVKYCLKLLIILLGFSDSIVCRQLKLNLTAGGDQCQPEGQLVYIQSIGDKDIIHYLWTSIRCIPPTLLIAESGLNQQLTINCTKLLNDNCKGNDTDVSAAISLNGTTNSIGFQLSQLFFFSAGDSGSYKVNDSRLDIEWKQLFWEMSSHKQNSDSIQLSIKTSDKTDVYNASIGFNLRVDSSDGRNEDLPHLAFTQKSVSLQMYVNDVQTDRFFNITEDKDKKSRLIAKVLVLKDGTVAKEPKIDSIKSIDDEYTPGVFSRFVLNLNSNSDKKEVKNSFISWKPVAYNNKEHIIANTWDVIEDKVTRFDKSTLNQYNSRIFEAFIGENDSLYSYNLTFGASDDDKFYDEDKYNSFALVVGVDKAPDEQLSSLVKMIIFVGFGLPLLVMVISAVYLIVRKIRKRNLSEVLLNQSQQTFDN